jgi:predicted transcriptional regulator
VGYPAGQRRSQLSADPLGRNAIQDTIPWGATLTAMPSESVKQRAIEAIRSLPEDATLEDAIERLCFIAKVEEGLRQSEAGELIPHEEIKKQFLS